MRPTGNNGIIFNHTGKGAVYYLTDPQFCTHHIQKEHILAYVYSGELWVHDGVSEIVARTGSCLFIRRNHRVRFSIRAGDDETIRVVFLVLNRNFLLNFYQQADKSWLPGADTRFRGSFLEIPPGPDIESLFFSLIPYLNSERQPSEKVMGLKLAEGTYALLDSDKCIASALFDFAEPWKIDILDFLNENFRYDLSLEEIALYTGRSLAAFKRDFKKISDLPPQKWITRKRLESAQQQLKEEQKKVSDIYLELGFKSLSHFSTAYKKEYGIAPTRSPQSTE